MATSQIFCALMQIQVDRGLIHYLVELPFEAFGPATVSAGIEAWSWVISEKPEYEIVLMSELVSAWIDTIKTGKGMFSTALK